MGEELPLSRRLAEQILAAAKNLVGPTGRPGLGSRKLEFDVMTPSVEGAFVRIDAIQNGKKPDPALVLPFRSAA